MAKEHLNVGTIGTNTKKVSRRRSLFIFFYKNQYYKIWTKYDEINGTENMKNINTFHLKNQEIIF